MPSLGLKLSIPNIFNFSYKTCITKVLIKKSIIFAQLLAQYINVRWKKSRKSKPNDFSVELKPHKVSQTMASH